MKVDLLSRNCDVVSNRDVPTRLHAAQARRCLLRVALLCFLAALCTLKSIEVRRAASSDALALRVVAMWGHHGYSPLSI